MRLFALFTGIFRTPSFWTSSAGWRGRRELAPRCSATRIRCISLAHIDRDMCHTRSLYHNHHKARQVCVACLCDLLLKPSGRHVGAWRPRTWCSVEAPSAPSSDALAARAAHAANAPGHVRAPRRPTGTEDGQGRGSGVRGENYEPRLLDPPLPQTAATVGYVAAGGASPRGAVEVCTDERRYGPVREEAPHLKGSEKGQGWGGGTRCTTRPRSGSASSPGFPATLSG